MKHKLSLSSLGHTWFIDIDGTICKHNGYKTDGYDTLLPRVKDFFNNIPCDDFVVLVTSRTNEYEKSTIKFLNDNGINYNDIIFNLPYGERILLNDSKPSGLVMNKALNVKRDSGIFVDLTINTKI